MAINFKMNPGVDEAREIFLTLEVYSEDDYRKLARRDRYLWDVVWFESEVINGGIDQYFYNSAADHVSECLEALEAIGAKESYKLLKRTCDLFPGGRPIATHEERQVQLRVLTGEKHLDDMVDGEMELNVLQHLVDYYRKADPESK